MHTQFRVAVTLAGALAANAGAQVASEGTMPMADYLGLLEQIAPAARRGAETYLRAHRQRCGRALTTTELRAAMSSDGGDAVLMGMIRASQMQDDGALDRLAQSLRCRGRK